MNYCDDTTTIIKLLSKLVATPSITPNDINCQTILINYLESLGFTCQRFDNPPVSNFFARLGNTKPLIIFAGHTDVVPVGDRTKWHADPFSLHTYEGKLFGRGTADMKGSIACMLVAVTNFLKKYPNFTGSLGFLITSGEEGDHYHLGTPHVMAELQAQGITPDYCILGEPSSSNYVGDVIKIGRRGSLNAKLVFHGKQGHVAYPHLADNPIHSILPALHEITTTKWDDGNDFFPATSLQLTHIQAGGDACNVIPGSLNVHLNFRYSPEHTSETLKQAIHACFEKHRVDVTIDWRLSGEPFITSNSKLLDACIKVIMKHTSKAPELSTSGGTSDGRFIVPYGVELIELGLINSTIHQINEYVTVDDLNNLCAIYYDLCEAMLAG